MDNIIEKKKYVGKTFLKVLEVEFFGLFTFLFFWAFASSIGITANIIFGIVGILMLFCIMADFGLKVGEQCSNKVKHHGATPCRNFGYALGAVAMTPSYILLGVLMLSKGGLMGNFLPFYKLLNSCFFPIIDLLAPTAKISEASPWLFILMLFAPLFYLFSTAIAYRWGYDHVDLKTKIMYKNK